MMIVMLVHIHVKADNIDEFVAATKENAQNSVKEPGVIRFDVIQQSDDPTHFTLIEVFKDQDAQQSHRETPHYFKWRDTVTDMMAEPRQGIRYTNVFPSEDEWGRA
ncbi:MAG: antibiotic biosynthesis monooxygenase [Anaerolineae bacterium]